MEISIYDRTTPLSQLRNVLGNHTTQDNLVSLVMVLCDRLESAEMRLEKLEGGTRNMPEECRERACSYFSHYLVYYDPELQGARLEHVAFHYAEKRCDEAQKRYIAWIESHMDDGGRTPMPSELQRQAEYWEREVCA